MAELIEIPGNSGPVNEGERRVIERLLGDLPATYLVAPNVEIMDPGGQRYEYDAIVVAPHAVYVIEIKDWSGRIEGDDREWLVNGHTRKAPLPLTERKAKVLKSKLVERAPALARVWVEAAVVLAGNPSLALTPEGAYHVFSIGELIAFLCDPAAVHQRARAIADLVRHVTRALGLQVHARSGPLMFGQYEVIERLEQGGDEALYRARHRFMPGAPPVRLRVVTLSPYRLTEQQRAERRAALYRETEALLRMGSHPNVIAARDVFDDDGRVVLVLDGVEGRTLRQRLKDGTPMTVEERLGVLIDVCRALAHVHAHGVVHRQVEPSSILLGEDGTTRLGNFSLAKIMDPGAATVWHEETPGEVDQRYLAPELVNPALGQPSPATDLYELGLVAYELFAGRPPFEAPGQAFGGMPPLPPGTPAELSAHVATLLAGDPKLRPSDAGEVLAVLNSLRGGEPGRAVTGPKAEYGVGDTIDGKFEVRAILGSGGFSAVYRVYYAFHDCEYALKVFNLDVPYEKFQREVELLRMIAHPHVVRAVWADRTAKGQFYIVSELVRGEPLEAYTRGDKRLSPAEAVAIIDQLLAALEAIHPDTRRLAELQQQGELTAEEYAELQELRGKGIVHRDIKPQNLMLTPNGIVLIDFNIASRVGQPVHTLSGTPPYQSPDVVPGVENWDVSPDLFATGVVLYELLCHDHPYENRQPRVDLRPRDPRALRPELSPALAAFLLKACAPYKDERFATAREMRAALQEIDPLVEAPRRPEQEELPARLAELIAAAPPNVNPMVREFLALSSQARRSNRGTRGLDDLARATYVATALDEELRDAVLAGRYRLVIVTGNAGDGKTAFIQQLEKAAQDAGAEEQEQSRNGRRLRYRGRDVLTLYDGSQDEADRTSDEVLRDFFDPVAAPVAVRPAPTAPIGSGPTPGTPATDGAVRIAAINEGRLRDFLLAHRERYAALATDVIAVLDDATLPPPREDVVVVNLNLRSVTAGGAESIFSRQLQRIVGGPFWGPCEACDYRTRCPLKHNVDTFRDPTSGPAVIERLRILVDLVRLRRRRHLTMRDVRSLLSHLLFRDRGCEEIPDLLAADDPFAVIDVAYFQGPGGLGVPQGSALERGAALLSEVDVALVANPRDDYALAYGAEPRLMSFPVRSAGEYLRELIDAARRRAGQGYDSIPLLARRAHEAARRQTYFERSDDGWWDMLPYRRLRDFNRALDDKERQERERLRTEVVAAISAYEGMADPEWADGVLWIATTEETAPGMRAFRRFPLADLELRVAMVEAPYVEAEPDHLELTHARSTARLDLDLDLVEVLERLKEGYVPSPEEGRGFLVNLALFKYRLLAAPSTELMLVADGKLLRIGMGAEPGSIVLSEVAS